MISVSSSDARKDLGLGFGGRAGKMEENEAEDGGAPSCSNGRSSDSRDDPDIALSYIDDKLENILGHFQKDFEGGISVENLGAKFGGYGSFLPMYELSPVRSHPKSPQEVQSHFILRSPNNSRLKESRSYCSASKPARPVCISRSTSKAPSSNVLAELKECVNSSNFGTSPEHKNLRVCIKVGSNDLTSQKNVLAFSEQGVDPSSLTFLEKSLSEGDEGFHGGADNSPTTILMAMISFPLHTDLLLSPLSDDLIQLGEEKGITTDDSRYFHIPKLDSEISHFLMDVPDSQNCDTMLSTAKKEKLTESVKVLPLPSSSKADGSCIGSETDKETDMQLCEELVFKTLRLPLLSCLSPMYIHPEKKISKVSDACVEAVEGTTQGVIRTDLEAALTGSKPGLEESVVAFSAQSVKETKNGIFLNRKRKDLNSKEGEFLTVISESKRKKAPNAENTPSSMDKVSQRETGSNQQKKSQKNSSPIVPAFESLGDESAAINKNKKNAHAKKLQEGIGESEDRYRKFCGDMGKSKEEIQSRLVDKVVKGKPSKHNVSDKSLHSEPQLLIYSSNAPPSTFRSISDVGLTISASTMIEDNWVLCEKCQKWRLLPNGMNPDSFPEDWDCSMLSWLPGMNCCTIHQDLTTEAVLRMHRAPSIEIQKAMNRNPGSTILVCNGEILENLGKEKERKSLKEIASRKDKEMHNNLPLVSEPDSKHLTKSNDSSLDGSKIKQNDTWRLLNQLSGEGEMKMERDLDRELCGTSKKPKTGESRCFVVDQSRSEKILKGVASDKTELTQAFVTEVKENANVSLHYGCDNRDVKGKRKLKDNQEVGGHVVDLTGNTAKKQKRLRVSSSAGKESDGDSVNAVLDRRVSQASDKYCASHPDSMATASSSFKSFGSRKTKTNIQEAKGSPIGLSPLKMLDTDKGRRNHSEKDEYRDTKFRASSGVKRWSNGERDHHDQKKKLDELDGSSHYSGKLKTEPSFNKNRPYGENCTRDKSQWKDSGELLSIPTNKKNQDMVFISDLQDDATAGEVRSDKCRSKKTPLGKVSIESCKDDTRVCQNFNAISDANGSRYYASTQKPETTKTIPIVQGEMVSGKRKKKSVQPSGAGQVEVLGQGSDVLNTKTQIIGHGDNVAHDKCVRNSNPNGSKMKGHDDISSLKKGSTSQAVSNSIKEATDLKHMADRLKNAGSNRESTSFYFQAALKFLYGASLLESSSGHSKHKSSARSRQIYDSTAKLCKFCAREYEKYKDMGAAALAYKCMEVAYLRMIYSSRDSTSRYRYELQAALQVIPSGESLSSATDVKNLSHTSPAEKASSSYVVRSPKVTGNQFISSESHFYLSQLLAFSQNAISAMDASRKAQVALGAAKGKSVDVHYDSDGISSIKRALDFNFQDMEGLLLVVRLAMEAINR